MTKKYKYLFIKCITAAFILNGWSNSDKHVSENKDPFEKLNRNVGPKTTRDLTGTLLDRQNKATISSNSIDDLSLAEIPINMIDKRSKMSKTIDNIYLSTAPYIKIRSFYLQNRRNEIYGKKYIEDKNYNMDAEFEKLLD